MNDDKAAANPSLWKTGQVFETVDAFENPKRYRLLRFLGGGATSLVWLACEEDEEGAVRREQVALKVLRSEVEAEWREAFETEIRILRTLRKAEETLGDGQYIVPEVYDISPINHSPAYLAMEFVSGEGVDELVRPARNLPQRTENLLREGMTFWENLAGTANDLGAVIGPDADISQDATRLAEQVQEAINNLSSLARRVEGWFAEHRGLAEQDILSIGAQTCRTLQLLHDSGYSYQDFQLTNIRWDRESPDIKIIDWNVVASEGAVSEESIQRDLNRLASYLFWLRTLVRPPDRGASPRVLSRLGGAAWSEQTSLAFRLVLERALDPDPAERYGLAYDFEEFKETKQSLFSLGDLRSLGAALDLVAGWYHNKLGEILALAGRYKEKGLATESLALIELGRKNLVQESDETRKQFQDYFDKLEKEIIAGANRPSFDRGKRYLEGRNATAAVEQFEQAVKDTPDDLEAHRWLALARSLSSLKLDPLREVWASGKLQKAMHALAIQDWDEALKKLQVPDLDLKALQIDAGVGQALSAAEVLATSKAGVAELLDKLDEVERLTNEHPSHPYIELVLQQWPRWKSWREQAMSMSHEESVSDDLRTRLQRAFATDFKKAVRLFRQELSTRPANSAILNIGLDESQKFLKAGKPEFAITVLSTALHYVGFSPHFAALRQYQKIAESWLNLRELVPREDWDSALQQAAILDSAPREIQQKAVWEMKQILEQPDNQDKFPPTPRGTGDMSDMSGDSIEQNREPTEQLSALIQEAKKKAEERRIQEERERRYRIVQQTAELEGQDTLESLRTAQQVTDGLLKSIPTDDPDYASVEEIRQRLENKIQQKEVESKRQEALQQAHGEAERGDRLSTYMDREKLEQAIEHYQKAAEWFRKADDETSADRAAARQEEIKRILDQLPDLSAKLDEAAKLLNRLETALELLDLDEETRRSLNLKEACALIAQVKQVHPQASRAQELTARARTIARRLGWPESKFQALIQPPQLDWAEQVITIPPPPSLAEEEERARWLRRIGAALSDLGDRDISQVLHKDVVDRAGAWRRQVLTDIFAAWKDGDMQAAMLQLPLFDQVHHVTARLTEKIPVAHDVPPVT